MYNRITISSGHGLFVRGASGILDEVDEARLVVETIANKLMHCGIDVVTYHDDVSESQNENLNRIVDWHNGIACDVALSIHFNAFEQVEGPMGTEVLYLSQATLAGALSAAIADAGLFIDRGPKKRTDLAFLNGCDMPAVLLEICFVDSETDAKLYRENFDLICESIVNVLSGEETDIEVPEAGFYAIGKCSYFGGPDDDGVSPSEGLAFIENIDDAPQLFLPDQPEDTTGLARRLNPFVHYVACRWNYDVTSKAALLEDVALVRALKTGIALKAFPSDWGPHESTGRVADLSPGLLDDLGIETDDEVEIVFPYREGLT